MKFKTKLVTDSVRHTEALKNLPIALNKPLSKRRKNLRKIENNILGIKFCKECNKKIGAEVIGNEVSYSCCDDFFTKLISFKKARKLDKVSRM